MIAMIIDPRASHELFNSINMTEEAGSLHIPIIQKWIWETEPTQGHTAVTSRAGTLQLPSNPWLIKTTWFWCGNSIRVTSNNSCLHPKSGQLPVLHIKRTVMLSVAAQQYKSWKGCICKDPGTVSFIFPVPYTSAFLSQQFYDLSVL